MGLRDLIDEDGDGDVGEENTPCPACGSEQTEFVGYYYRCHDTDCRVVTFITTDYTAEPVDG